MTETRSLEEFESLNHQDLVRYLRYKGVTDTETINDITQSYYVRLQVYNCLDKYDSAIGTYDAYMIRILNNTMSDHFNDAQQHINYQFDINLCTQPTSSSDAYNRINDFKSWIIKYGGKQSKRLLMCLESRIKGDNLNESMRTTYYRYMREYLKA